MKLSLIVPCYNEEKNIELFMKSCKDELKNINVEYIFINDGSKDNTFIEIQKIIEKYQKEYIIGINFSRNFGKEAAMLAGINESTGDYIAFIDADLQQHPKYIKMMYEKIIDSDYDSIVCYQEKRKESKILTFLKDAFYKIINKLSDISFKENASDFRLITRKMANSITEMNEYFRFSKGIFSYVGYNTYYMPYKVEKRIYGKSSWSIFKLFKYAIDGIVSFSTAPLKISTIIGVLSFLGAIIYFIITIIQKVTVGIEISGYATIVCLILLFGGLQMIFLGIIGEYIGRTYIETKNRPKYIIRDRINSTKNERKVKK